MTRAITFIGMSGVGKSFVSQKMADWGWARYSCDEAIGKDLLGKDNLTEDEVLKALWELLGSLGDENKGGLSLFEFKKRQRSYYHGECRSLLSLEAHIQDAQKQGFDRFVHDSTGSFCEINDEVVIESVGRLSQICYIKASKEDEEEVIERAISHPKPLYYPPQRLDGWVSDYLADHRLEEVNEIDPKEFSRWVFPKLFKQRLPKYQALADKYGFTVPSEELSNLDSEEALLKILDKYSS